jgi:ribosomal-protein-alanine N-acetyltransferase
MTHKGTVTLETERLILRQFTAGDAEDLYRVCASDPDVARFAYESAYETKEEAVAIITKRCGPNDTAVNWAILLKETEQFIGAIDVSLTDEEAKAMETTYELGKAWWHQGFAAEALAVVIKFAFEELKINRLWASYDPRNPNSGAVLRKCGLKQEAYLRQNKVFKGELVDRVWCAILAEDYFKTVNANITIIPYNPQYRDDMLFCFLSAQDALGKYAPDEKLGRPSLKDDLLDIEGSYTVRGDVFYLAIDERDRVVGMLGTQTVSANDLWLKRLFIKPELKGRGIGGKLLAAVEKYAAGKGITTIHTRFADWYKEAARFYPAKGFMKAGQDDYLIHMKKRLAREG